MPSPKERYLGSRKNAGGDHQHLVDSPVFIQGTDAAMLEYAHRLTLGSMPDVNSAMARHFSLLGAEQYLEVLKTLADQPLKIERLQTPNLNHSI